MDLEILKEAINTFNENGYMYQAHLRYDAAEERDMRPSECAEAAWDMVVDMLTDDMGDKLTDEILDEVKNSYEAGVLGNDDGQISHQLITE
jgi:hypothetical protein